MNYEININIERFLEEFFEKKISPSNGNEYEDLTFSRRFEFIFESLTGRKSGDDFSMKSEEGITNRILFLMDLNEYFKKNLKEEVFEKYKNEYYKKVNIQISLDRLIYGFKTMYKVTYDSNFEDTCFYQNRNQSFTFINNNASILVNNQEPLTDEDNNNYNNNNNVPTHIKLGIYNVEVRALITRLQKNYNENLSNSSEKINQIIGKLFGKHQGKNQTYSMDNLKDYIIKIEETLEKLPKDQITGAYDTIEKMKRDLESIKRENDRNNGVEKGNEDPRIESPAVQIIEEKTNNVPPKKFKLGNIDMSTYLKSLKQYAPYALGGTAIGLAVSAITPGLIWSGFGTVRIAYSTAKFANKIWAKLSGGPTPIDNIVTKGLDYLKDKMCKSVFGFDMIRRIEKANNLLKKPEVQWLMNGFAVGYKLGEFFELNDKIKNIFNNSQSSPVTVPNDKMNFQTNEIEPTMPSAESNINETIPQQSTGIEQTMPSKKPNFTENMSNVSMDSGTVMPHTPIEPVGSSNDYSWLDIGKEGDKIDLTAMTKGYTDSYAAAGAYKGPYEHLNKAVDLISKYATEDNGTFISEIRLPNGGIFTGSNVGELLDYLETHGIDPSKCAANICNSNGSYAWGNLEDVLEALSKGPGRGR